MPSKLLDICRSLQAAIVLTTLAGAIPVASQLAPGTVRGGQGKVVRFRPGEARYIALKLLLALYCIDASKQGSNSIASQTSS